MSTCASPMCAVRLQHVTFVADQVDADTFTDGVMFDGSSIAGWKAINESDMVLMPDATTAKVDPFFQETTVTVMCDILNPGTMTPYNRDPRGSAKLAEAYLKSTGVGDTAYFGPEPEFFVFDDVKWSVEAHNTGYSFDSTELPVNTAKSYETGNMGHRPGPRVVTSRFLLSTLVRTCGPKCSRSWPSSA